MYISQKFQVRWWKASRSDKFDKDEKDADLQLETGTASAQSDLELSQELL